MGALSLGKTALRNVPTSWGLPEICGLFFLGKTALSNVPTSYGLPKIWGPFFSWKNSLEQRTHKLGASRNLLPSNWNKECFWKFGPRIFRLYGSTSFFEAHNFQKNAFPTNKDQFSRNLEVQIYGLGDIHLFKNHGNLSEMGPYGSIWAHIKTGQSHMAQDHF